MQEYIRDADSIPGLGSPPGGGHGTPLQYSCLENLMVRGAWVGYSPWGCEVRRLKRLSMHTCEVFMLIERRALCFLKLQNASLMSRTLGGRWGVGEFIGMKWSISLRDGCLGEPGKLEVLAAAVIGPCFRKSSHPGRKENWWQQLPQAWRS